MWNDYLSNVTAAELCWAPTFDCLQAGVTVEALTNNDCKGAKTITEKEHMLRPQSIPPNEHDQYLKRSAIEQAHQSITEQAVE